MDKNNRRKFIKELGLISMGTFVLPELNLTAKGLAQATGMRTNIPSVIPLLTVILVLRNYIHHFSNSGFSGFTACKGKYYCPASDHTGV